ncbi:MAG: hypothetical protein ABMB14_24015 [Myxococcota bacterium]
MAFNTGTYSSLSDLLAAEALDGNFVLLLAERNNIPSHPAIYMCDPVDAAGSATRKVSHLGMLGYDLPSSLADGSTIGLTAISDGSTQVTAVRQTKAYSTTDLARMTLPDGRIDPQLLAADAIASLNAKATDLICDVIDGFSATGGPGSGNDLDVASVMALVGAGAAANMSGPVMGVIHGQQWSDLIVDGGTSIGSGGGGTQNYSAALAAMQTLQGNGFVGEWLGVSWYRNNRVKADGGANNRVGAIFSRGGVMVVQGLFMRGVEDPTNQVLIGSNPEAGVGGVVLLERARDAFGAETAFVSHGYLGASKGIEAGVSLISDL